MALLRVRSARKSLPDIWAKLAVFCSVTFVLMLAAVTIAVAAVALVRRDA